MAPREEPSTSLLQFASTINKRLGWSSCLNAETTWRIRLVAYGARLESVLGESPQGFESPILRAKNPLISQRVFFCLLAAIDSFARRTAVPNFLDTNGVTKQYWLVHIDVNSFIAGSVDFVGLVIDAHCGTLSGGLVEP